VGPAARTVGPGIGALVGMAVGGLVGYAAGSDCTGGNWFCINRTGTGLGGVGGAILGLPIGAAIGAIAAPGEKWERSSLDRLAFSIAPGRGRRGVRLALTVGF
jgi:hypothetical protein